MCSDRNGEADVVRVYRAISGRLKSLLFFCFQRGIIESLTDAKH